jgi:hypothetical protein
VLTVYVTHRQVEDQFRCLRPGQTVSIEGVPVTREPDSEGQHPVAGLFRVGNSDEPLLLLTAVDALARQAGLQARARDYDDDEV